MEIADIATSAGINIGLAILFFALYSVFRMQHGNAGVYFTRHLLRERRKNKKKETFCLQNLVPSAGWVKRAWEPTEDEILDSSGLDAVVFLRTFIFWLRLRSDLLHFGLGLSLLNAACMFFLPFSMRFFSICTLVGFGILAPLNYTDKYLSDNPQEKEEHQYGTLDKLTILNISYGSMRLWIHFAVLYFISLSAYVLLYVEFKHIAHRRQLYLAGVLPQPDQFTVLVRAVPAPEREDQSYSDSVEFFFRQFHPLEYLAHQMVFVSGHMRNLLSELETLKLKIASLKQKTPSQRRPRWAGICGLHGSLVDPIELHTQKMEDVYHQIREGQTELRQKKKEVPTAFVSFKTRWGAAATAQTQQSPNPMTWVCEWAPEPRDVDWPNLEIPHSQLFLRSILAAILAIALTVFYVPITGFAVALADLNRFKMYLPDIVVENVLEIPVVKNVIQGYLPALVLSAFLYVVPSVMFYLSRFEGYASVSHQERKAAGKVYNLLAGNVFLVGVLGGSLITIIDKFTYEPRDIPKLLAEAIPTRAEFFITYVMTTGWAGLPLEILQTGALILNFLKRHTIEKSIPLLGDVYSLPYYRTLPTVLLFVLLGLVYSIVNPLLLPFLLIYFILGYIVFRNQILHVYEPAYETGGQFWPEIHSRIIACVVLMQVLFIGMFSLKGLNSASVACIPLPLLTLLFHEYCRQRFLPAFKNFNLESTMKKDVDDDERGRKSEVLSMIKNAYLHPVLHHIDLIIDHNSKTQRLLPESSSFDVGIPPV